MANKKNQKQNKKVQLSKKQREMIEDGLAILGDLITRVEALSVEVDMIIPHLDATHFLLAETILGPDHDEEPVSARIIKKTPQTKRIPKKT